MSVSPRPLLLGVLALISTGLAGCSKRASAPVPTPSASTLAAPSAKGPPPKLGRLTTPSSFELAAGPTGVTLVWASSTAGHTALQRLELDARGTPAAKTELLLEPAAIAGEVSDLGAAWVKSRLALVWLERRGVSTTVRAAWAGSAQPPFELGAAWSGPRSSRGNVVVTARGDGALVFARGTEAACIEAGRHGCFAFGLHELDATRARPTGLPMSVPVPCSDNSAALAVVGSRFHYGVCTQTAQRPVTTMFSIERDPEYARADALLEGCTPEGMFVWRDAAWLVGDCEGVRRAVRVGHDPAEYLDLRGVRLECRSGELRLRAPSLDLSLDEPRAGLAPLLPPDLAPRGARAAWAGRALIVASSLGGELVVVRRACNGDRVEAATIIP